MQSDLILAVRVNGGLRPVYIGKVSLAKTSALATVNVLALATLGGVTQIGSFLFVSHCPRWPR